MISVILVTHNHEAYIAQSLSSILSQTYSDFELVVVNSGSTDSTQSIIQKFANDDNRILPLPIENRGPGHALNVGIARSTRKYVALLSGDDEAAPTRLETQLREMRTPAGKDLEDRGVLFSHVTFIGERGEPIAAPKYLRDVFNLENTSRQALTQRLLQEGNCLNAATFFAPRQLLVSSQRALSRPFHPYLWQLQDYDLWLRLIVNNDFRVIPEPLTRYRIRDNNKNLSAPSRNSAYRTKLESFFVLSEFLKDHPGFKEVVLGSRYPEHRLAALQDAFLNAETSGSEREFTELLGTQRIFCAEKPHPAPASQSHLSRYLRRSKSLIKKIAEEMRSE